MSRARVSQSCFQQAAQAAPSEGIFPARSLFGAAGIEGEEVTLKVTLLGADSSLSPLHPESTWIVWQRLMSRVWENHVKNNLISRLPGVIYF